MDSKSANFDVCHVRAKILQCVLTFIVHDADEWALILLVFLSLK